MVIIKIIVITHIIVIYANLKIFNDSIILHQKSITEQLGHQLEHAEKLLQTDKAKAYKIAQKIMQIADSIGDLKIEGKANFIIGKLKSQLYANEEAVFYFSNAIKLFRDINDKSSLSKGLYFLGTKNIEMGNYALALQQLKTSLKYSLDINDNHNVILINRSFGLYYYYNNKFEHALKYFIKCLKLADSLKVKDYNSSLFNLIGYSNVALCIYDKALENAFLSLKSCEENGNIYETAMSYHLIAAVYYDLKNYSRALFFNLKSIKLKKLINDKFLIASSYNSIGLNYFYLMKYDSALIYFKKGLELEKMINYNQGIALSLNYIGDVYFKRREFDLAKQFYVKAYNLIKKLDDMWGIAKISMNLGKIYAQNNNYEKAKYFLENGLYAAKQVKAKDLMLDCYYILSEYYKKTQNYKNSHLYLAHYISLKDSTIIKNTHRIAEMQLRYETSKRERENQILENKIAIQNLKLQKRTLLNWLLILSLIFVFSLAILIALLYRSKYKLSIMLKKKVKMILENYKEQQQIIVHQAGLTSLGEMAATISHEINQALQDIIFAVQSLRSSCEDNPILNNRVNDINADIDMIYKTVHHVRCFSSMQIDDIRESFNINESITDAYNLIRRQLSKYNIEISFNLDSEINSIYGNRYKFEQVILNILSNAKDAIVQKKNVKSEDYKGIIIVNTEQGKEFVTVKIYDNGLGITPERQDKVFKPFYTTKKLGHGTGLGLSIAYKTIKEMGGMLSFKSRYGFRTIFKITLPSQNYNKEGPLL